MKTRFSTIVLAGGRSRRMGTDKALLSLGHQTLLERTVEVAQQAGSQIVTIITPWPDRYQDLPGVQGCEWQIESTISSPLEAFYSGLCLQVTNWVLLLAVDLPRISSRSIRIWALNLSLLSPRVMAYLPKRLLWEPLCGFYRTSCYQSLKEYLADSDRLAHADRSFQSWLPTINVKAIPRVDPMEIFNCNTPQEWEEVITPPQV